MRDLFTDLDRWQQQHEEVALASLVRVHGSAPRLPGARLALTRSGKMAGSVSGGCVENDVFERAVQVLDSRQPVVAHYGIADELAYAVGLSCGGSIDVLIEPFAADAAWHALRAAIASQRPAGLGIALTPPSLLGRKLVVADDGTTAGSIDSDLDQTVAAAAHRMVRDGGTRILILPWRGDEATIFIEAFPPPPRLFIVGATHTAQSLCRLAKDFDFRVTVIDARGAYATTERFPDADELRRGAPDQILDAANLDAYSYVVILTHDPKFDVPALARALRSDARYIGIMGSRSTHEKRTALLRQDGFTDTDLSCIRAPIGLDIGSRTPNEIALAILAEMLAVRAGRDGRALADKGTAIHGDR